MAKFGIYHRRKHGWEWLTYGVIGLITVAIVGAAIIIGKYMHDLSPVSNDTTKKMFVIGSGASVGDVASNLYDAGLIRSASAFQRYVSLNGDGIKLQAGTYKFSPNMGVSRIVGDMVDGKVDADLMTILPAQRIDLVRQELIQAKFSPQAVDAALDPVQYSQMPMLADKPASANLEGYLYPDSYSKEGVTDPKDLVKQALNAMNQHLTPDIRAGFSAHGLNIYQGITMASIVEREVSTPDDRAQVAQVIYKRLATGMSIESDVTAFYGAIRDGRKPSISYNSPYNTYQIKGLPIGPISNVSDSSLVAVAHPASTDWLFFVAGDDGHTYFSKTITEHQALTQQHCKKLCSL